VTGHRLPVSVELCSRAADGDGYTNLEQYLEELAVPTFPP
jgi:hypothetical protein